MLSLNIQEVGYLIRSTHKELNKRGQHQVHPLVYKMAGGIALPEKWFDLTTMI